MATELRPGGVASTDDVRLRVRDREGLHRTQGVQLGDSCLKEFHLLDLCLSLGVGRGEVNEGGQRVNPVLQLGAGKDFE